MIPKIIHYCWFGGKSLPSDVKACIESWKKYCTDYKIVQWNENNFDISCHPFVKKAYDSKAWAFVSDYARLRVVYENGGIYLDTDVELLKSLDFLLENECYIGIQQAEFLCATGLGFGAQIHNPVVHEMLKKYDEIEFDLENKEKFACPWLNNDVIARFGNIDFDRINYLDGVTVYPPRFFDPLSAGRSKNLMCEETVSIHHYSASWTNGANRFKRKLIRMFGQERFFYIAKFLGRR